MKTDENQNQRVKAILEEAGEKLGEAELYAHQGLFSEAGKIYRKILDRFEEITMGEAGTSAMEVVSQLQNHIREKLKEVDFLEGTRPQGRINSGVSSEPDDGLFFFSKAIALKKLGLHDEAVVNFKKAEKKGYSSADCFEEIGGALIEKGQYKEGLAILRRVFTDEKNEKDRKSRILDIISDAHKKASADSRQAPEVYQELASSEKLSVKDSGSPEKTAGTFKKINFPKLVRLRVFFLVLSLIIGCFFTAFNPMVETVDNVDYFRVEDDPDAEFYDSFKEIFGGDDFFIISYRQVDLFSAENLTTLRKITEDLEQIEEIREVTSLANVDDIIGEQDYFEVRPFMDEIPESSEELLALKKSALENSIYVGVLISRNGDTAAILIETYEDTEDEDYKKRVIEKTRRILKNYETDGIEFYLAGPTITNFTLSKYVNQDMAVFMPVTFVLIAVTVWFFFRNIPLTIVALLNIGMCVGATRGFMGMAGLTLNNITSIVIPLVMALSLCDTVHIFSHLNKRIVGQTSDRFEAMAHVLRKVALPCLMTTVTTSVGFLSLSISRIPPIQEFAWAASAGMVFEFFFSFFFLPPLLLFFTPSKIYRDYDTHAGLTRGLHWCSELVKRRCVWVLILTLVLLFAAVLFASRIRVETNLIEFFKAGSPIRTATDFVETNLSGVGTFDISLKAENEDAFKTPANLEVIEKIQKFIESRNGVDQTISFVDLLKDMNESFHGEDPSYFRIPDSREMVAQYLLLYDSEEIEDFVNSSFDHARIAVRTSVHGSMGQKELIGEIRTFIENIQQNNLDIRVTGRTVNDINIVDDLVRGQILSLGLAALIISFVMLFVFKSAGLAILSMFPNFFPIVINFGIMGLFGIPLDTGTALIAAVALGIAVDDTVHFLSEYRSQRSQGMSIEKAIKSATLIKGRAIVSSSIILSIGFGVLILSRFVPIVHFGFLTASIMLTAVVGDLIVLPAILYLMKDKKREKRSIV